MSLINDLTKLAGIPVDPSKEVTLTEKPGDADVSPEEVKMIRNAIIKTVKHLEREAKDTQRPSLTSLYKKDADVYDDILGAVLKNSRATAKRIWDKQDTGCKDHIFELTDDVDTRRAIAKYFGTTLLKESEKDAPRVVHGRMDPDELEYRAERGDGYAKAKLKGYKGTRKDYEEDRNSIFTPDEEDEEVTESEETWGYTSKGVTVRLGPKEYAERICKERGEKCIKLPELTDDELADQKRSGGQEGQMMYKESASQRNHMGERTFQTFAGWKKACKASNSEVWFDGDKDIANAMVGPKPYVRGKTRSIGEWDGAEGSVYSTSAVAESKRSWSREDELEDSYAKGMRAGSDATNPYKKGTKDYDFWNEGQKDTKDTILGSKKDDVKEAEEPKVVQLDLDADGLEKKVEAKPEETDKVPAEVFSDINKKIKEVKFKIEHLSHIDPTYQEHGYWARFILELEKITDMLKVGTDESFKEAMTELQKFENVAAVEVPDSLWKFLSMDMYKTPEQRKTKSLVNKFQEVKYGKGE